MILVKSFITRNKMRNRIVTTLIILIRTLIIRKTTTIYSSSRIFIIWSPMRNKMRNLISWTVTWRTIWANFMAGRKMITMILISMIMIFMTRMRKIVPTKLSFYPTNLSLRVSRSLPRPFRVMYILVTSRLMERWMRRWKIQTNFKRSKQFSK